MVGMEQTGHPSEGHLFGGVPPTEVRAELERILASAPFARAQRLSTFLQFTVEQLIEGRAEDLKEYAVGVAVFNRDAESYDTRTDPIVRVEAGRLRAKLREYYDEEGKCSSLIIELPKGTYIPIVRRRELLGLGESAERPSRLQLLARLGSDRRTLMAAFLVLLAISITTWTVPSFRGDAGLGRSASQLPPEFRGLWAPFIAPGTTNFAVVGNPVFFVNRRHRLFVRPYPMDRTSNLTSDPQLLGVEERLGPLIGPRYDYALMGDAIALQRLTSFLAHFGATLTASPASQATWDSIKSGNVILIGAPRMHPLMKGLPTELDFDWDDQQNVRNRKPAGGELAFYTTRSNEDEVTYAVVAALPGLRPNRELFVIAAHAGPGTLAAVDYITQPDTVKVLNDKLRPTGPGSRRFQMLLRVFVDKGSPTKAEYITHHSIP